MINKMHSRNCLMALCGLLGLAFLAIPRMTDRPARAADVPVLQEPVLQAPSSAVEEQRIRQDIEFLASDALEGRDTGSPGMREAAEFILEQFRAAGLTFPAELPDGIQRFSLSSLPELGEQNLLRGQKADETLEWVIERDYIPCSFGGAGEFSAPVVFCGYGIKDPERAYNEFEGIDLKGKIALILRRVPGQTRPGTLYVQENGNIDTNQAALRTKLTNAREQGAVAVLFVNDVFSTREGKDELLEFGYGGGAAGKQIPVLHITQKVASGLLQRGLGLSLEDIDRMIETELKPASAELQGLTLSGKADLKLDLTEGQNLIAVLEPSDPAIQETIVVGAHYDHVGWGRYGSLAPGTHAIHNGADDNASGTTAVLALARRLKGLSGTLPRRVVLICFAGEERGLMGSKHYVSAPVYPLEQTVAMINLDMVGRMTDEKVTVFGVGSSDVWKPWLDELEQRTELNFFQKKKAFGPSDHASFYEKQIPVLHLFTGLHEHYHRPHDDADKINEQGIRRIVDLLTGLTLYLANAPERPNYIENKQWIRVGNHAGGRAYFGITPDLTYAGAGFQILLIEPNSPAAHAGLEPGDRIVALNGQDVATRVDLWKIVDAARPKEVLKLQVHRGDTTFSCKVELGKPR